MSLLEYLGVKPTLPRFAARVLRAMPADVAAEYSLDLERGMLVRPGGGEVSLQNMFAEYRAARVSDRAGLVVKYASLASSHLHEIPDLWVAAAKNVYPVVRSQFVDSTIEIKSRSLDKPYLPVVLPFAGDLRVRLVYDFGSYLGYIRQEQLDTWGQSAEEVAERGIANLGKLDTPGWVDSGRGFFQLASEMSFEESLLQLDSVLRQLPFAPHAVLMPCNRGVLLAADGRSEDAIGAMLAEAEQCLERAWPMSSQMCQRVEGGWDVFEPPLAHANLAHGLAIRHLGQNYGAQKEELDALHQASDEEIYVAEYSAVRIGEQWQSYCVWSQGVTTLLPTTDWVAVLPEGETSEHIRVHWPDLVSVCGHRMAPTSESPTRFRVDSFPDASEWSALVKLAIPDPE